MTRLSPERAEQGSQGRRPQRLVQQRKSRIARGQDQVGIVISADERRAETWHSRFAQPVQQFDTVDTIAQMIVGEYRVDVGLGAQHRGFRAVARLEHVYAPLAEQSLHPIEDRAVVIDAQDAYPLQV